MRNNHCNDGHVCAQHLSTDEPSASLFSQSYSLFAVSLKMEAPLTGEHCERRYIKLIQHKL